MWYICTMEYYSAIERNEVLTPATMWMNLENITLVKEVGHTDHLLHGPFIKRPFIHYIYYMECPQEANL